MEEILLGDEVKCKYTGVKGIAMDKTEFINGCVQFGIAPKWDSKSNLLDQGTIGIDSQSLIVTKKGPRHIKKTETKSTGGPMRRVPKMRGY